MLKQCNQVYLVRPLSSETPCEMYSQNNKVETYLAVQWLRHWNSTAEDMSSIPNWGARIPYAMCHGQKIEKWILESPEQPQHIAILLKQPKVFGVYLRKCNSHQIAFWCLGGKNLGYIQTLKRLYCVWLFRWFKRQFKDWCSKYLNYGNSI